MFMEFYHYLFYQSYRAKLRGWGKYQFPEQWAVLDLCLAFSYNFMTICLLVFTFLKVDLLFLVNKNGSTGIVVFLILLGVPLWTFHYYVFLYKKKYKKILKSFSGKEKKVGKVKLFFTKFYSLISVSLLIASFLFLPLFKG